MTRLLPIVAVLAACSSPSVGTIADSAALAAAARTITPGDVQGRVAFLASDELMGRETPSPGLEAAAGWIAEQFESFGLVPAGDAGWFQRYPYPAVRLAAAETQFGIVAGATHFVEYGREFFARRGRSVADAVGAVYAPPALDASRSDLRGRAVVVRLDVLPSPGRRGLRLPRAVEREVDRIRDAAEERGAAAVVFVLPRLSGEEAAALAAREEEVSRILGGEEPDPIPLFFLTREAADHLFRAAGLDATLLDREIDEPLALSGVTLQLGAPSRLVDDARPPNVVALLEGSDPSFRDQYVLLTAHMDHVGVGTPDETGDSIYNGADDNASGTTVLVEVAEALAALAPRPPRSVVFLAVSGEEKGLLGSYWFSENPTVPLEDVIASINVDMVGRNSPDSIVVIGQEYSTLGATVREIADEHPELGLTVAEDLWPEERFFFRSDHFNMARKEIPTLFFFAGTHEDYHRPGDELDVLDTDKTARVARLVFYLTHAVAAGEPPRWDPEGLETVRRLTRR